MYLYVELGISAGVFCIAWMICLYVASNSKGKSFEGWMALAAISGIVWVTLGAIAFANYLEATNPL